MLCLSLRSPRACVADGAPTGDAPGVDDSPALPFRVLRRGLRAASRAGANVVERVLRREDLPSPAPRPATAAARAARIPTAAVTVRFGAVESAVARGHSLLEAAQAADVDLRSYCGGNCSCGTCRVEVLRGGNHLSPMHGNEAFVLGAEAVGRGDRLACQAQALGDVEVRVPEWF